MDKERLSYLDLAAGIMTLWVMYFHAPMPHNSLLYFFMPWFFYKSGQMYTYRTHSDEWHKGWTKLVKPFIVWSLIGYVAYIIWGCCSWGMTLRQAFYTPLHSLFFGCHIPMNTALWFLPILFIVRLLGNYLLPKINHLLLIVLCFAILVILAIVRSHYVPVWISHTIWGLFFFTIGYDLREKETNQAIIGISGILFVLSFLTPIPVYFNDVSKSLPWHEILWYPCCACGCVVFNNVCRIVDNLYVRLRSHAGGVLHYIGKHAINFYTPHFIIFSLSYSMVAYFKEEWYDHWQGALIVILSYMIFLPIINQIIIKIERLKSEK